MHTGRNRIALAERKHRILSFSYSPKDDKTIESFIEIVDREAKNDAGRLYVSALAEYVERHGAGNSQTMLTNWSENGEKSLGLAVLEIVNRLSKGNPHGVKGKDVNDLIKDSIPEKLRREARTSVRAKLKERGVIVWE